ncbi:MAG: hypothetical protein LBK05_03790 [Treponema sp.]|jgi:hypothetical protein|nr:hypothetical protein [Treponema sp.]
MDAVLFFVKKKVEPGSGYFFLYGRIPGQPALKAGRPGTGLYACIFFARGKKGYRFNPLRGCRPFCKFLGYVFYRKVEKVKEGPVTSELTGLRHLVHSWLSHLPLFIANY